MNKDPSEDLRIKRAQEQVELERLRVESAFDELEARVRQGRARFDGLIERLRTPERLAKKNPYLNLAVFLVLGFAAGTKIGKKTRESRLPETAPPPFPQSLHLP